MSRRKQPGADVFERLAIATHRIVAEADDLPIRRKTGSGPDAPLPPASVSSNPKPYSRGSVTPRCPMYFPARSA
jgi:hypothetical protein